jgi:hypothetical protein
LFSLYSLSGVAYDFFRHFVPLPCAKLLRKEFGNDVKECSSELRNADAIASIVSRQSLPVHIPCTLCVGAFSVDTFKSKSSTKARRAGSEVLGHLSVENQITLISEAVQLRTREHRDCLQENSIFLFLLAPLDVSFRIFSIHLNPYKSGLADTEIQQLCARIIGQLSANHSVGLAFVSVDGNPGYQAVFDRQFERLLPSSPLVPDIGPILQAMQEFPSRKIGDFLHFLKNAWTRVDQKIVHCDCSPQGPGTSVTELSRIFGATRFVTDSSPNGRMRDSYPF